MVLECDNYLYDSIFNLFDMHLTLYLGVSRGFKVVLLKDGIKRRETESLKT
jgi:hypothetical protein